MKIFNFFGNEVMDVEVFCEMELVKILRLITRIGEFDALTLLGGCRRR